MADGLDALLQEAAQEKEARATAAKMRTLEAQASAERALRREQMQATSLQATTTGADSALAVEYSRRLRSFLELLLDARALEAIHEELSRPAYSEFESYYATRPELARYTLDSELKRMGYVIRLPDGRELMDAEDIRSAYEAACGWGDDPQLLWRAANQSLLADLLAALQSRWMDPTLSIAVSASHCSFDLDMTPPRPRLRADCTLTVQTLGAGELPLQLAECNACIEVVPAECRRTQTLLKPRLCECVVFEESMLAVAGTLARCEASRGDPETASDGGLVTKSSSHSAPAAAHEATTECASLEDVTKQLERFMTEGDAQCEHDAATASARSEKGLLSGLFSRW